MITRASRLHFIERSMACFARQTLADRELVIVHDGAPTFNEDLDALAKDQGLSRLVTVCADASLSLGALRNLSVASANGEFLCQWDDDDLYHQDRLAIQLGKMRRDGANFSFMTDQLHLYERIGHLYWEDWIDRQVPNNWIPGTIIGRKDRFPEYPDMDRGEDTDIVEKLLDRAESVSLLSGQGHLYIYTYNGQNTWDMQHHVAISQDARMSESDLLDMADLLRRSLPEYLLPYRKILLPHDEGVMEIEL